MTVLETRPRGNVTQRRGRDVPQRRYWLFHLGVTGRRRRNVLMGRSGYVPLTRLGDVLLRRHFGCFI